MTSTVARKSTSGGKKPAFRCTDCGATSLRWVGRCPECQSWGTVDEVGAELTRRTLTAGPISGAATPISELDPETAKARATGIGELDRVLGGGLVQGSVVLLAGEPGVGKSTLLLEVAHQFATGGGRALIVTGEESTAQVRLRAERTASVHDQLFLAAENDLGAVLTHIDQVDPGLLVLDSVQTVSTDAVESSTGSVAQIRAVTAALIAVAKSRGMATVLVGHVTKDGGIAGPRVLEHLVDVVLHFEGDRHSALRLVRATKNRYGAADEVGCFEMRETGIYGLADPSGMFLADRRGSVAGTCAAVTLEGRRPMVTEVQSLVVDHAGDGALRRAVRDLDAARVSMMLAVLQAHCGSQMSTSRHDVYASTVGGIAALEPAADLAVACALASALAGRALAPTLCAIGEVSLAGDIRRVPGLDRRLAEAARLGFTTALVPEDHRGEELPDGISGVRILPVGTIAEALGHAMTSANSTEARVQRLRPVADPPSRASVSQVP